MNANSLNRYANLVPFKHSIVKLNERDTEIANDSYINANYINTSLNDKILIAT